MKKILTTLLIAHLSIACFSQVNFEPGYFINNEGLKIECLIKNLDWIHNPDYLSYKTTETSEVKSLTIREVREFSINEKSRYKRFYVQIDRSTNDITNLSDHGYPDFEKDTLLLKCLVAGKKSLYQYSESKGKLLRFFYSTSDDEVEQLIYKIYSTKPNELATNTNYRNQLRANVSCEIFANFPYKTLAYKSDPLSKYFLKYNSCKGSPTVDYNKSQNKYDLNINLRPGLNYANMTTKVYYPLAVEYPLESKICPRFGIELEYVLPFKNNKWAIILEPTFQLYNGEANTKEGLIKANYNSIELPLGLKYSIFLNDHAKIYISTQYSFDLPIDSYISFEYRGDVQLHSTRNFIAGIGFQWNDIIFELRNSFNRNSLNDYVYFSSKYSYFSMVFGYKLF